MQVIGKEKNLRQHLSEPYLADGRQDRGIRHHLQGKKKNTTQKQNKRRAAACQRVMFASAVLVAEERQGQGTVPLPVTADGAGAPTRHKSKQTFLGDR